VAAARGQLVAGSDRDRDLSHGATLGGYSRRLLSEAVAAARHAASNLVLHPAQPASWRTTHAHARWSVPPAGGLGLSQAPGCPRRTAERAPLPHAPRA
jgi:hypothetical protein